MNSSEIYLPRETSLEQTCLKCLFEGTYGPHLELSSINVHLDTSPYFVLYFILLYVEFLKLQKKQNFSIILTMTQIGDTMKMLSISDIKSSFQP